MFTEIIKFTQLKNCAQLVSPQILYLNIKEPSRVLFSFWQFPEKMSGKNSFCSSSHTSE